MSKIQNCRSLVIGIWVLFGLTASSAELICHLVIGILSAYGFQVIS
jgi:hypothetical protein